jgi:hypothetical protein
MAENETPHTPEKYRMTADEAPFYQVYFRWGCVHVETRLQNDSEEHRETFPRLWIGFSCTPQDWDAMIASDRGASYINLMGPVLAEDPHFAPIRDRVEALLLDEFGARCENGARTKEI